MPVLINKTIRSPFVSDDSVEITKDGMLSDTSSKWSIDSAGISTSRGDFASWQDVGVVLETVPIGPGREWSSDSDADLDDEDLVSFLWVHSTRLRALLGSGNVDWEHLACFSVSQVLRIPIRLGGRFHDQPDPVADVSALACFLEEDRVGPRLKTLLSRHSSPRPEWDWETFLFNGVGKVLRLPPAY